MIRYSKNKNKDDAYDDIVVVAIVIVMAEIIYIEWGIRMNNERRNFKGQNCEKKIVWNRKEGKRC